MENSGTLPLPEFLHKYGASARLQNVAIAYWRLENIPYTTTLDFVEGGKKALQAIFSMPNAGRKTVNELKNILHCYLPQVTASALPANTTRQVTALGQPSIFAIPKDRPKQSSAQDDSIPLTSDLGLVVERVVGMLAEGQRAIIRDRFGLSNGVRRTLGEVGTARGVTRERIRQIESKSVAKLRARYAGELRHYVEWLMPRIWQKLSMNEDAVAHDEVERSNSSLSPEEYFLIQMSSFGSISAALRTAGTQTKHGWLKGEYTKEHISGYVGGLKRALESSPMPRPEREMRALAGLPENSKGWMKALVKGGHYYRGYVHNAPFTARIRRAVHLHQLLVNVFGACPAPSAKLFDSYLEAHEEDKCGYRDLEIVLTRHPHLFLNLYDEGWIGLGASADEKENAKGRIDADMESFSEDEDGEGIKEHAEPQGIADALRALLVGGPLTFVDLRSRFVEEYGRLGSKNSVGPNLVMRPTDFARIAPGIYGLRRDLKRIEHLGQIPEVLLSSKQIQLYSLARRAGERMEMFPAWTPVTEYGMARWARRNAEPRVFQSLLAVASIDQWPIFGDEREQWRELQRKNALFQLEAIDCTALMETIPTYREILGVGLLARHQGRIGWMSANRAIGARVDDTHIVSILSVLIGMGLVKPPAHWQCDHPLLADQCSSLDELVVAANNYAGPLFQERMRRILFERLRTIPEDLGWVNGVELKLLTETLLGESDARKTKLSTRGMEDDIDLVDALKEFRRERVEKDLSV